MAEDAREPSAPTKSRSQSTALDELDRISDECEKRFRQGKRVLSFREYLDLFATNPARHGRDAAAYTRDMFDHFGTEPVQRAWGVSQRFKLFDLPWESKSESRDVELIAHEELQAALYGALQNFVSEGRANRLVLMHGPNGSAKSTTAGCILRALERYSTTEEGALYRFHWVFPSRKTTRGSIGFGDGGRAGSRTEQDATDSYAHLSDDQIDTRLVMEIRDHPLFLLPVADRRPLLQKLFGAIGKAVPAYLVNGQLSHKNQQVFEALMMAENGSLSAVLRHVQVERFFISRRYRVGAITLGPELSVDAGERQITTDRSLAALPTALQATTLFEAHGELIDAAGGVLEFSDLLKRPLDAFRYLQLTLESGEVALPHQTVQTNVVMIGSANDVHLHAFREHPEFPSFRGRFELVAVPYLRSVQDERRIYDAQIAPFVGRFVAPHATLVAAEFAVLSRLQKPKVENYADELSKIVKNLTVEQKLDLYATGAVPDALDADAKKVLKAGIERIYREFESGNDYEGRAGASPRTMRGVLLNAAQASEYECLSPFAVLQELEELCRQTTEYDWLREKATTGGYHDHKEFRAIVRRRLLDRIEEEMRFASGLVDESRYSELFDRYISNVNVWVKGETVKNRVTGADEKADERLMKEVEGLLGITAKPEEHRKGLISFIAAWAIDHPGQKVVNQDVFPDYVKKLKETVFVERRKPVALLVRDLVRVLRSRKEKGTPKEDKDVDKDLGEARRRETLAALERLKSIGYDDASALDAASAVLRARYAELVTG
ncbi:MAG: serine protein kinase PrkA [Polyangiaceae bacterium]